MPSTRIAVAGPLPRTTPTPRPSRGTAERRRVDPGLWRWAWPKGPGEPLQVAFDRPLDHALLQRCIRVLGWDGAELPGEVRVPPGERSLSFQPAAAWQRGRRYGVSIDSHLEDLAGNSLR